MALPASASRYYSEKPESLKIVPETLTGLSERHIKIVPETFGVFGTAPTEVRGSSKTALALLCFY